MKLIGFAWGLLSIYSSLLSFDQRSEQASSFYGGVISDWFTSPVIAQCIQADVSVQYNISGSQEPTERTNDVDFQNTGACQGNVSITTGVQGNVGGNSRVRQNRIVRHRIENGDDDNSYSDNSIVQIKSNPAIDVYNAADNLKY